MKPLRHSLSLLCAMLFAVGGAQADDLGRLFTTSAERAHIDALRAGMATAAPTGAEPVESDQIILNGTLTGSDGKRLAWINGTPVAASSSARNVTLLHDGQVRLQLRDGALKRDLKPGQGVDTASGQVFETYERAPPPPVSAADTSVPETPEAVTTPTATGESTSP